MEIAGSVEAIEVDYPRLGLEHLGWKMSTKELTHGLNTGIVVWEGGHPFWGGETDIQTVLAALLGK